MGTDKRRDDALHGYWQAVAEDVEAPPPEGIDPLAAEMVRGLRSLRAPGPDPAFVARLGARLKEEVAPPSPTAPPAPPARPISLAARRRRPILAGLATAAAVMLAVLALLFWSGSREQVSATAILHNAEATGAGTARFRSFVITEVSEQYPTVLAGSDDLVRNEITRWYEAPNRWRREVTSTVLDPDGTVKSRGGLVSVSDGATVWIHRLRDNTVIIRPEGAAGADELGPFPEVTGGLSGLLGQAGVCYTPQLVGSDTIAGRATHVIALGRSRCTPAPDAAPGAELVEWTVWVDKETFLILKSVQEADGAVVATSTVTSIQYNVSQDTARFSFTPPSGAKVRDGRK